MGRRDTPTNAFLKTGVTVEVIPLNRKARRIKKARDKKARSKEKATQPPKMTPKIANRFPDINEVTPAPQRKVESPGTVHLKSALKRLIGG